MDKDLRLDYLPNHPELKIYQHKKMIKINTDTQVLGEFIKLNSSDTILDIGTNTGALLLYANMFKPKKLLGLDINEEALKVCKMNMELHNITNYELICDNAMTYVGEEVDVIVCNPPYFKTDESNKSNDKYLNLAKHESEFTLEGMIKTAYKNLKPNGKFYMLFTSQRFSEVILLLNKYHFEVKLLKFVYDENKEYSNVFMVKTVKHGQSGMFVEKPIIISR